MRKRWICGLTALCLAVSLFPARASAADETANPESLRAQTSAWESCANLPGDTQPTLPEDGTYVGGELLVKVKRGVSLQGEDGLFGDLAASSETLFPVAAQSEASLSGADESYDEWTLVRLADGVDMLTAWRRLLNADGVVAVEPNRVRRVSAIEDVTAQDPYIHSQTWLKEIRAPEAWADVGTPGSKDGTPVVVAVVDTGVDLDHPDLKDNLLTGYDFVNKDDQADDDAGHGTHVAGIIAAENNAVGVRGVAYDAKVLPVKVMDANGTGTDDNICKGIAWAAGADYNADTGEYSNVQVKPRANIVNLSLGGFGSSGMERDAADYARAHGVLVVASAGNDTLPTSDAGGYTGYYGADVTPSNLPGVLTVMAEDTHAAENGDWLAYYSNYDADPGAGAEYEIMAPGTDVVSTYMDGGYGKMSGTSMACPVVSGAAAVLMGKGRTVDQVWNILTNCAKKQGKTLPNGTVLSYPALDLGAAVAAKTDGYAMKLLNCAVSSELGSVITPAGNTVSPDLLNNGGNVLYQNGAFCSTLRVSFENAGAAGTVTISGTAGGAAVSGTAEVGANRSADVTLTVTGTPAVADGSVAVNLTLKPPLGETAAARESLRAVDGTYPSGIKYDGTGGAYQLNGNSVTLKAADRTMEPLLVLDKNLNLTSGQDLLLNGYAVYETGGATINVVYENDNDYGSFYLYNSLLFGSESANLASYGYGDLYGDVIVDPKLVATNVENCLIRGSGDALSLNAWSITGSRFANCGAAITARGSFERNLVNGCAGGTLTVPANSAVPICHNTFVENFGTTDTSVFTVRTTNYAAGSAAASPSGFYENSVIGPMNVYSNAAGVNTAVTVDKVYYQKTKADDSTEQPAGVEDKLNCAAASVVSSDLSQLAAWGFADDSPAFVTGLSADYSYDSGTIDYTLTFQFSAAVDPSCSPSCYSYDDLLSGGRTVSLSNDAKSCVVTGKTEFTDPEMTQRYYLCDYYTAKKDSGEKYTDGTVKYHVFWSTAMYHQKMERFPVRYTFKSMDITDKLTFDSATRALSWTGAYTDSAYTAKISRSVNDGDYEELGAAAAGAMTYTLPKMDAGGKYAYRVDVYSGDELVLSGEYKVYVPLADKEMGVVFAAAPFTSAQEGGVTASLAGAAAVDQCMQITLASTGGTISSIEFSDQVKNSGIPYGALKDDDGAVVYLGVPDSVDFHVFAPGELFTVRVSGTSGGDVTVPSVTNKAAACAWGKNDTCTFEELDGIGRMASDQDNGPIQLWRAAGGTGGVLCAHYNGTGRMTSVEALNAVGNVTLGDRLKEDEQTIQVIFLDGSNKPIRQEVEIGY